MQNQQDRDVSLVLDPSLLGGAVASFTDKEKVSGDYVADFISESGIEEIVELPQSYYTIDGLDGLAAGISSISSITMLYVPTFHLPLTFSVR